MNTKVKPVKRLNHLSRKAEAVKQVYEDMLDALAAELLVSRIKPVCDAQGLTFCNMNGFPQFYRADGNRANTPASLCLVLEAVDPEGNPWHWRMPDYNPNQLDVSACDIKHHRKRAETDTRTAVGVAMCCGALLGGMR